MDPDEELLAAIEARRAPRGPVSASNDIIEAEDDNGNVIVWMANPSGRGGRWQPRSYETANQQSRERVEAIGQMYQRGERALPYAERFVRLNTEHNSGGMQNDPNMPQFVRNFFTPNGSAARFAGLSQNMISSQWQPGTTGMFNTATEVEQQRARFPAPTAPGPENEDAYLDMAEETAAQRAAYESMQRWLGQNSNLQGWDAAFAREAAAIRARARREAYLRIYPENRNAARPSAANLGQAQAALGPALPLGRLIAGRPAGRLERVRVDTNGNPVR